MGLSWLWRKAQKNEFEGKNCYKIGGDLAIALNNNLEKLGSRYRVLFDWQMLDVKRSSAFLYFHFGDREHQKCFEFDQADSREHFCVRNEDRKVLSSEFLHIDTWGIWGEGVCAEERQRPNAGEYVFLSFDDLVEYATKTMVAAMLERGHYYRQNDPVFAQQQEQAAALEIVVS